MPARFGGGQLSPDGVEQKRARSRRPGRASRWLRRLGQRAGHDLRREPIGRVVFSEIVSLRRIDQAFVQRFEDIDLDIAQAEARGLPCNAKHQVAALADL